MEKYAFMVFQKYCIITPQAEGKIFSIKYFHHYDFNCDKHLKPVYEDKPSY